MPPKRLTKSDIILLKITAEHRLLTVEQAAWIADRPRQSVYRAYQRLMDQEWVQTASKYVGQNRGRPKVLMGVTEGGIDVLQEKGILPTEIPSDRVIGSNIHCPGHQVLMNWFRIFLQYSQKVLPSVSTRFIAHNSPFIPCDPAGRSIISNVVSLEEGKERVFIPDGVLSITDKNRNLTILLFLEVDCGTETLASPKREMTDIRQKIINYQSYFLSEGYKKYEQPWNCQLRGFHLLFVTNSPGRLAALCQLVRQMGAEQTGFIYLTEQNRMFEKGLTADIWAKGGDSIACPQSIFTSMSCTAPLPCQR